MIGIDVGGAAGLLAAFLATLLVGWATIGHLGLFGRVRVSGSSTRLLGAVLLLSGAVLLLRS